MQSPVTGSHSLVPQLQGLQLGNPQYPVAHMEHSRPITFGLQWHWPPNCSQVSLSAPSSWQAQGIAPLLKKADRDTAELRQNGEAEDGSM